MRYLILILLPLLSIFLQSTIFHTYSIKGAVPDLVLVFVVFYSLLNDKNKSTIYGFFCGLLEDLYLGRAIGMNAIAKACTAFLVARLQGGVFKDNVLVGIITVLLGSIINSFLLLLLYLASYNLFYIDHSLFISLIYQIIYNAILAAPLYAIYYRSTQRGWLRKTGD